MVGAGLASSALRHVSAHANGAVRVTDNGAVVGTGAVVNGVATVKTAKLKRHKKHKLTVSYVGFATVLPSSGGVVVKVK